MDLKLQVLICTFGERIGSLDAARLPEIEGVGYLISWQNPEGVEAERPVRKDIEIHEFADRGISRNRNHAFDAATAPYLLVSDDDLIYNDKEIRRLVEAFDINKTADIILLRSRHPGDKFYPDIPGRFPAETDGYFPMSIEIALRRSALEEYGLRFTELAGIGAPYLGCGEEEFFMHRALKSGAICRYFPIEIAEHTGQTTSTRNALTAPVLRAKGAVIRHLRGSFTAATRYPVEAWRSPAPFLKALWHYWEGFFYSLKYKDEL